MQAAAAKINTRKFTGVLLFGRAFSLRRVAANIKGAYDARRFPLVRS